MSESFRHREVWRNRLLILPSVLLLTAFVIYPAFVAIQTSLTNAALTGPAAMSPRFIGLANYSRLLSDGNFWRSLAITFWFVLFSAVIGQLLLGLLSAILLRRRFALRPLINAIILMPNAVPEVVAALMWASMLAAGEYGTLNNIVAWFGIDPQRWLTTFPLTMIVIINIWRGIGFAMILMTSGLSAISDELYEAAWMDGASASQIFRRITLPLLVPTIFLYLLVSTVSTIGIFGLVFALTRGGPAGATEIIGIYIYNQSFNAYQLGYGSAVAVVVLAFSLVIGMIYVRALKVEV
ncbi:sugar ABC transporter permease [Rhizobium oryzihabitans]|uniref:Sugar ABC transporter permease n=1 Tax=Rhizobium oryzihabitans TaxID=2267833 RepID=A0A7L5BNR2_9HYPH|nr:sugar ABC transporter permease [Agrobacterium tumefaciens]QCM12746.1 sugar ABC transporter permease [Agrobacterium tumefaciens]QIB40527.1 sugar ABC transporter permease [Rhizobium oryzihabitans]CUX56823.1 Binding-protein-dependent transport systems inner membrane component [Agrobacterium genomosp. 5 str. CFBP 6626]HCD83316.1 sugar ABC transporter permease [Agrobacterium sp.]